MVLMQRSYFEVDKDFGDVKGAIVNIEKNNPVTVLLSGWLVFAQSHLQYISLIT